MDIRGFPKTKQDILKEVKTHGSLSALQLQSYIPITTEALRKHLVQLQEEGFVNCTDKKSGDSAGGRPTKKYYLTVKGDHLFPKNYDLLAIELIDTIASDLGDEVFIKLLSTMTHARINKWKPQLEGLPIEEQIEKLKGLYLQEDAFMDIEKTDSAIQLIEHNCPFLNIVTKRPALCSVTVSTLRNLLGYEVTRTETFQSGDRRCVFRINLDQPLENDDGFKLEHD